ncbi:hypothetical protein [Limnohabitans sp. 2KL-27]|uniref:hypothetical protein n=1 Tax=Limnohabitans sp. 2KL-27 TaxID=1100705 RepID=UPI001892A84F|nr:hypothetical protein [Limnohabitans sp. 2KL-27]
MNPAHHHAFIHAHTAHDQSDPVRAGSGSLGVRSVVDGAQLQRMRDNALRA